jgi:hypothetical protein
MEAALRMHLVQSGGFEADVIKMYQWQSYPASARHGFRRVGGQPSRVGGRVIVILGRLTGGAAGMIFGLERVQPKRKLVLRPDTRQNKDIAG